MGLPIIGPIFGAIGKGAAAVGSAAVAHPAAAIGIGGVGLQAASSISAARAQRAASDAQYQQAQQYEAINRYNAQIALQQQQWQAQYNQRLAQNQSNWANYQAGVDASNATARQRDAQQQYIDLARNLNRKRKEDDRLMSAMRARYARAGVAEAGSPLEVLGETRQSQLWESQELARGAAYSARDYLVDARDLKASAAASRAQARFADYEADRYRYEAKVIAPFNYQSTVYQGGLRADALRTEAGTTRYRAGTTLLSGAAKAATGAYQVFRANR